jgi:hypothetical protein
MRPPFRRSYRDACGDAQVCKLGIDVLMSIWLQDAADSWSEMWTIPAVKGVHTG